MRRPRRASVDRRRGQARRRADGHQDAADQHRRGHPLRRRAAELAPEVGVVVLSQHAEPVYALSLFENGSSRRAYLLKERVKDRDELARALREVAAGRSFVDSRIVDQLVSNRRNDPGIEKLTPREREILALIAEGRSNTSIAESLEITKRAVERHINAIFAKLDLPEDGDVNRRVKATLLYLLGEGR